MLCLLKPQRVVLCRASSKTARRLAAATRRRPRRAPASRTRCFRRPAQPASLWLEGWSTARLPARLRSASSGAGTSLAQEISRWAPGPARSSEQPWRRRSYPRGPQIEIRLRGERRLVGKAAVFRSDPEHAW